MALTRTTAVVIFVRIEPSAVHRHTRTMIMMIGRTPRVSLNDLKPLTCVNCGGKINEATMTCQFCGTEYQYDNQHRIRLVHSIMKFETLEGMIMLPSFFVHDKPEQAMEMGLHEMAEKMVEKIMPLIEYRQAYDPRYNEYRMYGRVRVGVPQTQNYNVWETRL